MHTFTQKKKNRRGEFLVIDKYNIDRTVSTRMLREPGLVLPTLPILLAHKLNSKVAPSINRVCWRLLLWQNGESVSRRPRLNGSVFTFRLVELQKKMNFVWGWQPIANLLNSLRINRVKICRVGREHFRLFYAFIRTALLTVVIIHLDNLNKFLHFIVFRILEPGDTSVVSINLSTPPLQQASGEDAWEI